jgi:hypothetical protein
MKKKYLNPLIDVVDAEMESVICASDLDLIDSDAETEGLTRMLEDNDMILFK